MKEALFLFLFIFLLNTASHAQNPLEKQWDNRFGGTDIEIFTSIIQAADGGYLLGGWSDSGSDGDKTEPSWGNDDYWIVKTDAVGNKLWDKRYGGTGFDVLEDMSVTSDGGFILGGYSTSGISGDKSQDNWGSGYPDYWIVKIDSLGTKQWDKRFGGLDDDDLVSVQQTTDGGYVLGGYSFSGSNGDKTEPSWGGGDFWMVKTDSTGNMEWDKRFGGSQTDFCTTMQQTADGGYVLAGFTSSGNSGDKTQPSQGFYDYWVVKTDSAGNKLWDKRFGGTQNDEMISLKQCSDGGYILGGASGSGIGGDKTEASWGIYDYWIVKIDSAGIKEWDRDFGGTDWEDLFGTVSQTSDGGYFLAGTSYSPVSGDKTEDNLGLEQAWVVKTDGAGIKQWDKTVFTNGHDEVVRALQSSDGCYVIGVSSDAGTGGYKTDPAWGGGDYWFVKFCDTTALSPSPVSAFNSSDTDVCEKFCIDFFDQSTNDPTQWQWYFEGGSPSISTDANPVSICFNNPGIFDVTLITTNSFGSDTLLLSDFILVYETPPFPSITQTGFVLTSSFASSYQWQLNSIDIPGATNQSYTLLQSGYYTLIVGDSNGCTNSVSDDYLISGIDETLTETGIILYPNPTTGKFIISILNQPANNLIGIRIINTMGQLIYSSPPTPGSENKSWKKEIDLNGISPGVYLIKLQTMDSPLLKIKLIVEQE